MTNQIIPSLKKYFETQYQLNYPTTTHLNQARLRIKTFTDAPTSYFDLIRVISKLYNVRALRNQSSMEEGLYVVGREALVDEFISTLIHIIESVEKETDSFNYKADWTKLASGQFKNLHGHEIKRKFRGNLILIFVNQLKEIEKNYTKYARIRYVLEHEKSDEVLIVEFIKSYSNLRTKTPLQWK